MNGITRLLPEPVTRNTGRRLSDKILVAFHHACDSREPDIARQLLDILESLAVWDACSTMNAERRKALDDLVGAHQRLWQIRNASFSANDRLQSAG